jgi:hypothetical protein
MACVGPQRHRKKIVAQNPLKIICSLHNCSSDYIVSHGRMTGNKLECTWKEAVAAKFEILAHHFT